MGIDTMDHIAPLSNLSYQLVSNDAGILNESFLKKLSLSANDKLFCGQEAFLTPNGKNTKILDGPRDS